MLPSSITAPSPPPRRGLKSAGGNLNALAINNAGVIRATGSKTVNGPQG
jgi:hypothetical protein